MLSRPLPPLSHLQAFEAAARLGSISQAALERHLTHSAISRAVQAVEAWHGVPLFDRRGPRLQLNAAGEALRERLAEPLRALHAALGRPSALQTPTPLQRQALTLLTLPSVAATWLLPRLPQLLACHPELALDLQTRHELQSLPPELAAVAIRFGQFKRSGLRCWPLWRDRLVAVAAPDWVAQHGQRPTAWPAEQRLQLDSEPWPLRLPDGDGQLGRRMPPATGLRFNDALLLVQATLLALGVAWVRRSLVTPWLDSGALQVLAEEPERLNDKAMWLVCRDELADVPAVQTFVAWALAQRAD